MTSSSDRPADRARPSFAERVAAEGDTPRPGYQPMPLLRRATDRPAFVASLAGGAAAARPAVERRRAAAPAPAEPPAAPRHAYARFIPREELDGYAAWTPDSFGEPRRASAPAPDPAELARQAAQAEARRREDEAARHAVALQQARDGGYQDGYRDGLAALEAFKQAHAAQTGAQVAALMQSLQAQLDALEQHLGQRVAGIALEIARQVVRTELRTHAEAVVAVAHEALDVLLVSARHVTLVLHPDDHALVAHGLAEALRARGARLVADAGITRGGCLVQSDIGVVDARVETRWARVSAAQGRPGDFDAAADTGADVPPTEADA